MSDYGDDNSDYGDEWMYVEEEYMVADDLAEHAVASPTLAACAADDDAEWDRFDYFNDLEYASDGYDDAKFEVHTVKDAQTGQKRKRDTKPVRSTRKRPRPSHHADGIATNPDALAVLGQSPVVWRSQSDRGTQPKMLDNNAKAYTLLGDWRERLPDTPQSTRASPPQSHMEGNTDDGQGKGKGRASPAPVSPLSEMDVEDEGAHAGEMDIDPGALMAALQSRLAEAGGPLSGMDPQQLLEFAMRMAGGKDTGDEIAGEMADAIFDQGDDDEEDDTEAEANLLSWVAKQKNAPQEPSATAPSSSDGTANRKRPPSPPLSETNSSAKKTADKPTVAQSKAKGATNSRTSQGATKTATKTATAGSSKANQTTTPSATTTTTTTTSKTSQSKAKTTTATENSTANSRATRNTRSLKRKADDAETDEQSVPDPNPNPTKKRATRSFDAPTAASEARSAPARSTRSARGKR
jgi:hypothetical protein